jgi:hypothetical protein
MNRGSGVGEGVGEGVGVLGEKMTTTSVALVGAGDGSIAIRGAIVAVGNPFPSPFTPKNRSLPSIITMKLRAMIPPSFMPQRFCFGLRAGRRTATAPFVVARRRSWIWRRWERERRRAFGGAGEERSDPLSGSRLGECRVSMRGRACLRRDESA